MYSIQSTNLELLEKELPQHWQEGQLREIIAQQVLDSKRCIVVLDDDPTGTQTVYDTTVLTTWGVKEIRSCLEKFEPILYILTNSRSVPEKSAVIINREIAQNLLQANKSLKRPLTVVSRSDSTLRGHYPAEIYALEQSFVASGEKPFDGVCIIPFFPEGGRYTANDIHWVQVDNYLLPASQTPYSLDPVFGYKNSCLPEWVEEKTKGEIPASSVVSISLQLIREGGPKGVLTQMMGAKPGTTFVINALDYRDMEVFVKAVLDLEEIGKKYLFRTAASFVKVAGGLQNKPLLKSIDIIKDNKSGGGLIVFGSFVSTSTLQLMALLEVEGIVGIELPVEKVIDEDTRHQTIERITRRINDALPSGMDVVVYTSRNLIIGKNDQENLAINQSISSALMEVVKGITVKPCFLLGKGGITSSDMATSALNVKSARIKGQIYPGVPVWGLGEESLWPGLPFIIFPGNVGQKETIAEIVNMLRECKCS